jgi:aminopeptidase-like protein
MALSELQKHLYSLPEQPDLIPYVASYYKERWGFCLSENQSHKLKDSNYHVFINSDLKDGNLTYGEIIIPGNVEEKKKEEIFFS